MTISVSKSITHHAACEKVELTPSELQQTVINKLEKLGVSGQDINWSKDGHLELLTSDKSKLHTLMLQMESLGLELKMTEQTLINIC